jgi:hypothetical protein
MIFLMGVVVSVFLFRETPALRAGIRTAFDKS